MKTSLKVLSCALLLSIASAKATDLMIKGRVIDTMSVMRDSEVGRKAQFDMEKLGRELGETLKKEGETLQLEVAQYNTKKPTLSEEARQNTEKKLVKMQNDYKAHEESAKQEFQLVMQQTSERIAKNVDTVVEKFAVKEGLDVVWDVSGRIVYSSPTATSTDKILTALNEDTKATQLAQKKETPTKVKA